MLVDKVHMCIWWVWGESTSSPSSTNTTINVHIFQIMHTQLIESALMCVHIALSTKKKIEKGKYLWG